MHAPDLKIIYIHSTNVCNTCPNDERTEYNNTHITYSLSLELIANLKHNHVNTHNISQSINTSIAHVHQNIL